MRAACRKCHLASFHCKLVYRMYKKSEDDKIIFFYLKSDQSLDLFLLILDLKSIFLKNKTEICLFSHYPRVT
jgi:hypothetical protein